MLLAAHLGFIASLLIPVGALQAQVPLWFSGADWRNSPPGIASVERMKWRLDEIPNPNATEHLVFETVHSLLQFWPNARIRNGHNIVPGIIPEGTLLYHGTSREEIPSSPEWVAFDPEHAHYYCQEQKCWQITFTTTRPLKVIYFDGKSASKNLNGSLDTQNLLVWGDSCPEHRWDETGRAESLCKWGMKFNVDGFVRMEYDFEAIICDFTSGIGIVSFSNIAPGLGLPLDISAKFVPFEMLIAGGWHSRFPGETRIQLDLAGIISFYDTQLVPSLVAVREGQERWEQRVQDVSKEDLSVLVSRLEATLIRPPSLSSGIEWKTLIQTVIDRYAGRLELTQHLVNTFVTIPDVILDLAIKTQIQLRIILAPYLHLSAVPTDPLNKTALDWTAPIFRDCATTHTNFAVFKLDSMTDSEKLLLRAVQGTNGEICRVVTKMWAAGVYAGIDPSLNTKNSVDIVEVTRVWNIWGEDLNRLMAWLDWHVWIRCKPSCGPKEICIFHEWPMVPHFPTETVTIGSRVIESGRQWTTVEFTGGLLQPKCVNQIHP